jgi:type II secretory pathway pseudopilin PulG
MRGRRKGFTFVEILAAMVFMAIVIPVLTSALVVARRTGTTAERSRVAVRLADALLTELTIDEEWRDAESPGDFGDDYPNYRYTLEESAWDDDSMQLLTLTVYFQTGGQEHHIRVDTLVDDSEDSTTATG